MVKKSIVLFYTLSVSISLHSVNQTTQTFYALRAGGLAAGAAVGGALGAGTGYGIVRIKKPADFSREMGLFSGASFGGLAGTIIGSWAGSSFALRYLAKKYNVSPAVVEAAIAYDKDLAIETNRHILHAADKKNKKELSYYFTYSAQQIFGDNGIKTVQNLINEARTYINESQSAWVPDEAIAWKVRGKLKVSAGTIQVNKLDQFVSNAFPLALLYFHKVIPTPETISIYSWTEEIELVHQLLQAVF